MPNNSRLPLGMLRPVLLASVTLVLGVSRVTSADPIVVNCTPLAPCIDFAHTDLNIGGTLMYAGGSAPLVGIDIPVNRINGFFTPEGSDIGDALVVENGVLNFETGAFDSFNALVGYRFSGGGSFTIRGSVPALNLVDVVLAQGSFLQLHFLEGTIVRPNVFDTKQQDIVEYFGMPAGLYFLGGFLTTELVPPTGGAFTTRATTLDLPNTPTETAIPEPMSLLLVGSGAFGLLAKAGRRRRR